MTHVKFIHYFGQITCIEEKKDGVDKIMYYEKDTHIYTFCGDNWTPIKNHTHDSRHLFGYIVFGFKHILEFILFNVPSHFQIEQTCINKPVYKFLNFTEHKSPLILYCDVCMLNEYKCMLNVLKLRELHIKKYIDILEDDPIFERNDLYVLVIDEYIVLPPGGCGRRFSPRNYLKINGKIIYDR